MDILVADTLADSFCNYIDTLIIYDLQTLLQFFGRQAAEIIAQQTIHMLLQGTECFHQSTLKIIADTHDLTGRFHLGGQSTFCSNEFIKRQTRNLYYTVVQCRFKACVGLLCNRIFDFIQGIAQCDLRRYFCNRITCCLGCQRRRTAYTGIYLDNTIFKTGGMKSELYVTSTGNLQLINNVQGGASQHLIFFVT